MDGTSEHGGGHHDVKKLRTTVPLAYTAAVDDSDSNDDDITDHDKDHLAHHVSSRTGGFEMPRYDDFSEEEVNIARGGAGAARNNKHSADDDTLQDSSIYTDPYKIVGPRSTDGGTVIVHDCQSAGVCSTATTVQLTPRERQSSPLYTGDIESTIEVYKRALRVRFQSQSSPRPPSTIATTRVRINTTPSVIEVRRNRTPLTPVTSSSSNIFWKQRTTPTTQNTATTTTSTNPATPTTPLLPSPTNNNNNHSEQSGFWKSPPRVDQPEQEPDSSFLRRSWRGNRRRARLAERTRSSSTSTSTNTVCSSTRLDPQLDETDLNANADSNAAMAVPCNLFSRFKLAGQMNDDEEIVGVSRIGQGLSEKEEPSRAHELATVTTSAATTVATPNTATTASSSSPSSNHNKGSFSGVSGGEDVDEGFEVADFATAPTPTKPRCSPVQEEDDCDEDDNDNYISSSSSSSAHSSTMELDLQVNNINVSDTELMQDIQNPGVLRLTAEGLQSHERQSFQKVVHMHGRGGNSNDNDNHTYEQWRRAKLQQKWHREKHNERQEKLTDQNIRIRQSSLQQQQQEIKSTGDSRHKRGRSDRTDRWTKKVGAASKNRLVGIKSTFVKDDVEGVSLAPLNMMENLDLNIDADEVSPTKAIKFGIFGLFRSKSSDVSATARDLLHKERQAAAEAHKQKRLREQQEKQRIEGNRQAYLEIERIKESDMSPIHMRVFSEPLPGLLGDGDWI